MTRRAIRSSTIGASSVTVCRVNRRSSPSASGSVGQGASDRKDGGHVGLGPARRRVEHEILKVDDDWCRALALRH